MNITYVSVAISGFDAYLQQKPNTERVLLKTWLSMRPRTEVDYLLTPQDVMCLERFFDCNVAVFLTQAVEYPHAMSGELHVSDILWMNAEASKTNPKPTRFFESNRESLNHITLLC